MIDVKTLSKWSENARMIRSSVEQLVVGFEEMTPENALNLHGECILALREVMSNVTQLADQVKARGPS